jgi:hypothetical protein
VRERTERRIRDHARKHYSGRFSRLDVRFKGALCYVDAYFEPAKPTRKLLRALGETSKQYCARLREVPVHLCRLRYFGDEDAWSFSLFTYSHERYEPCVFHSGSYQGTPEDAFDVGAAFL